MNLTRTKVEFNITYTNLSHNQVSTFSKLNMSLANYPIDVMPTKILNWFVIIYSSSINNIAFGITMQLTPFVAAPLKQLPYPVNIQYPSPLEAAERNGFCSGLCVTNPIDGCNFISFKHQASVYSVNGSG